MEEEKYQYSNQQVESWMFRVPYEHFALLLSLVILIIIGFLLYTFNLYIFLGLLIGTIIYIQLHQAQYLGNAIRVHSKQYTEIYEMFKNHATHLGIQKAALYIKQDPFLQAYTLGLTSCTVVLTSSLVEQLEMKELNFIIAHELGHYKAGHTKLSTLFIPIGSANILSGFIFGFWNRKAEYSSDRCGLILTKDIDGAISALVKLTVGSELYKKLNVRGFVAQIKAAEKSSVKFSELLGTHPLTTNRIKKLVLFWRENFVVKSN